MFNTALQSFSRDAVSPQAVAAAAQTFFKALGLVSETQLLEAVGELRTEILAHGASSLKDCMGATPQISREAVHRIVAGYDALAPDFAQAAHPVPRTLSAAVASRETVSDAVKTPVLRTTRRRQP